MSEFRLLMISAMYENGGNVTHRFLDGHPEMLVYPFESQLGTALVHDPLTSMFPVKYRWPVFDLSATPQQDFHAIIDEECRVRGLAYAARTGSSCASMRFLGIAPWILAASWPLRKTSIVGIAMIP